MISFNICKAASYQNLPELRELLRDEEIKSVKICMTYNVNNGLPSMEDEAHWPFEAYLVGARETYHIRIYSLTVGYGGSGPTDFEKILKFFKVPYVKDDIFTKRQMDGTGLIKLEFSR